MNTQSPINWQEFKETLKNNQTLPVLYQITDGQFVDPSYHITEIKQGSITSVDCGGVMNAWTEVIVQLWEPEIKDSTTAMTAKKALSIIELVETKLSLHPNAIVKIEFGNDKIDTKQMHPSYFHVENDCLTIDLRPDTVQCKAIERGGSCETTPSGDACCSPIQPKTELKTLNQENNCSPGSGCC